MSRQHDPGETRHAGELLSIPDSGGLYGADCGRRNPFAAGIMFRQGAIFAADVAAGASVGQLQRLGQVAFRMLLFLSKTSLFQSGKLAPQSDLPPHLAGSTTARFDTFGMRPAG